ncbi:hypothetical protein [Candidatus Enterococcus lemimoniae]|uniref:Uncharacterized protein n=1 Tax=Candidatus Enterococcus lemimoniae TaxID=1834167 RepID=A0ABZ2T614_9ENTE|nr:hypothetical protein [Enterococcus sp. 12C11_DIV0727]OTO67930.1 hypothetical protein A5866_000125 [Enterococcus sp. 12C11_DIV0727]
MLNLENILIPEIAKRLKDLRVTEYRKIPPELISHGQKSRILNIEKARLPKSGNFISDTLLDDYARYFTIPKAELIFGTSEETEKYLLLFFFEIFSTLTPDRFMNQLGLPRRIESLPMPLHAAIKNVTYAFADFGRWYELKQAYETADEKETIDFLSMYKIIWRLCKKKITRSFEEKLIPDVFNDKFYFNRINEKVMNWLLSDITTIIFPEMVEKLKSDSIFKMGYIVKGLIDEALVQKFSPCYLKNIPLEEFLPPIKSFHVHLEEEDRTEENMKKLAEETFRFLHASKERLSIEDLEALDKETFFEGVRGVTDESSPFVNDTRIVDAEEFIDYVMSTPTFFDKLHELNRRDRKIPGVLTVNSHASTLLQVKVNEVFEIIIDDLVRYQNIFINCIKWEELEDFAK